MVWAQLRDQLEGELAAGKVAVLHLSTAAGQMLAPVRYRSTGLVLDCLLPRWLDGVQGLSADTQVRLITLPTGDGHLKWLDLQGTARPIPRARWPDPLPRHSPYLAPEELHEWVRIHPSRLQRFDEATGWGIQSTLDLWTR